MQSCCCSQLQELCLHGLTVLLVFNSSILQGRTSKGKKQKTAEHKQNVEFKKLELVQVCTEKICLKFYVLISNSYFLHLLAKASIWTVFFFPCTPQSASTLLPSFWAVFGLTLEWYTPSVALFFLHVLNCNPTAESAYSRSIDQ